MLHFENEPGAWMRLVPFKHQHWPCKPWMSIRVFPVVAHAQIVPVVIYVLHAVAELYLVLCRFRVVMVVKGWMYIVGTTHQCI